MKQYARIYAIFFKNAMSYQAQYRANTWFYFVLNFFWIGMRLFLISVFFEHTNTIAGWNKQELFLMAILWTIADEIALIVHDAIIELPDAITDGAIDGPLTKPASTLFLLSLYKINIFALYRLIGQVGVLAWIFFHFNFSFSAYSTFFACLLFFCALLINYSFLLIINTLGFWFYRINNVNDAWFAFFDIGNYPISVLPKQAQIFFLTFIPVAFTAHIPVATITGRVPWYGILYALLFTSVIFLLALLFWRYAIKKYSSASS